MRGHAIHGDMPGHPQRVPSRITSAPPTSCPCAVGRIHRVAPPATPAVVRHSGCMSAQRPAAEALPGHRLPSGPYRVCLVCLGNICRSPMAEVVLREELAGAGLAEAVTVES